MIDCLFVFLGILSLDVILFTMFICLFVFEIFILNVLFSTRVRVDQAGGAWCPRNMIGFYNFIMIIIVIIIIIVIVITIVIVIIMIIKYASTIILTKMKQAKMEENGFKSILEQCTSSQPLRRWAGQSLSSSRK